jgi:hypothetical protein
MLTAVLLGYPSSKANAETIAFYVMALDDLSFVEIRAALSKLTKTAKFFPTVAEIYEAAESVKATAQGTAELDAGQAWEEVMRLVKTCHMYKPWSYSTPEVEQAVKQFGKMELISLEESAMNTARAQFRNIYNGILSRKKEQTQNKAVLARLGVEAGRELAGMSRLKLVGGGKA